MAFVLFCVASCGSGLARAQVETPDLKGPAIHRSLFVEYSNDSSHMLLGVARQRKLVTFGASYSIRLLPSRFASLSYYSEFRPLILESDPTIKRACVMMNGDFPAISSCYLWKTPVPVLRAWPQSYSYETYDPSTHQPVFQVTDTFTYGRRWSYAMGLSPIGYDVTFLPGHRWRPVMTGLGGLMIAAHDLPLNNTSNFNFTFEFGAGMEHRVATGRAWRMELRYHHISNDYIGFQNPGIDSTVFHVGYIFGR